MLDSDLEKKLRLKQAKLIKNSLESVSFSDVLEQVVETGLKTGRS